MIYASFIHILIKAPPTTESDNYIIKNRYRCELSSDSGSGYEPRNLRSFRVSMKDQNMFDPN